MLDEFAVVDQLEQHRALDLPHSASLEMVFRRKAALCAGPGVKKLKNLADLVEEL